MSSTSRTITSNDRMKLYKYYGMVFEWSSGIASNNIRDGHVQINGIVITDVHFEVKDDDILIETFDGHKPITVKVEIPTERRESVHRRRRKFSPEEMSTVLDSTIRNLEGSRYE